MTGLARKLRVLCLHGYRTNAKVMENQSRGLRQALGGHAEYLFLNAPHLAHGDTDASVLKHHAQDAPFYEWYQIKGFKIGDTTANDTAREEEEESWVPDASADARKGPWRYEYLGFEDTLALVDDQLNQHGPFDVAVGFSQGSVVLSALSMYYLRTQNTKWWDLSVCVGGVRPRGKNCQPWFENQDSNDSSPVTIPLPSIHVIGQKDPYYKESLLLADMYADESDAFQKLVLEHDGGHKFPSAQRYKHMYEAMADRILTHFHIKHSRQ